LWGGGGGGPLSFDLLWAEARQRRVVVRSIYWARVMRFADGLAVCGRSVQMRGGARCGRAAHLSFPSISLSFSLFLFLLFVEGAGGRACASVVWSGMSRVHETETAEARRRTEDGWM
jgi:hypothetical protein